MSLKQKLMDGMGLESASKYPDVTPRTGGLGPRKEVEDDFNEVCIHLNTCKKEVYEYPDGTQVTVDDIKLKDYSGSWDITIIFSDGNRFSLSELWMALNHEEGKLEKITNPSEIKL